LNESRFSGSLVEVVGLNVFRSCGGEFECVVGDALFFSSRGIVYESNSVLNEVNLVDDTVVEGGNCKDKALVFCGLVSVSNFRCQAVGVLRENHAFVRVWDLNGSVFCFDPASGSEVDCGRLRDGFVFFDSRELRV
jgi:hypothetical protein